MAGKVIAGRYALEEKLGEGGMGAVYRAQQLSLKRTVALKVLRPELSQSPGLVARFNAEAELAGKLNHPNTVTLYDFGQDIDGSLFIAMEYLEGQTLREVLQRDRVMAPGRALHIADQVCASLADAHANGIVHRDLKPDNVMLVQIGRRQDNVRVLDFGIAKVRDGGVTTNPMTRAGDLLGTPQYMAPEQIRGEKVDQRTDVYALGVMLYEMVTGVFPFEGQTVMAIMTKHLTDTPTPPHLRRPDLGLPLSLSQLISDALEKDLGRRPPSMDAFAERIAGLGIATTSGVHTPPPGAQGAVGVAGALRPVETPSHGAARSMPSSPPPGVPLLRPSAQGAAHGHGGFSPTGGHGTGGHGPYAGGAPPGAYGSAPDSGAAITPPQANGPAHAAPTSPGANRDRGSGGRKAIIGVLALAAVGAGAGAVFLINDASKSDQAAAPSAPTSAPAAGDTSSSDDSAAQGDTAEPDRQGGATATDFNIEPERKIFADSSDDRGKGGAGTSKPTHWNSDDEAGAGGPEDADLWPGGWYKASAIDIDIDVPAGFSITEAPNVVQFEGACDGVPCLIRAAQAPGAEQQNFAPMLSMLPAGQGTIGSPGRLRVSGQDCYSMIAKADDSSHMVMCPSKGAVVVLWVITEDLSATRTFRKRFFAKGVKL